MSRVSAEIIEGLQAYDSATIFNAMVDKLGLPNEEYTSREIRCLLPDLGSAIGYAVTAEVTTNDPDSPIVDWIEYYAELDRQPGPLFAVLKDVDSRPGRGASFGDGMARLHKRLGVVGVIVEGTVRDLSGIGQVGLPVWAWGTVPGHGAFHLTRHSSPVTIGQLRVRPHDLILADGDGCVRIPTVHAPDILRLAAEVRAREGTIFDFYDSADFSIEKMRAQRSSG